MLAFAKSLPRRLSILTRVAHLRLVNVIGQAPVAATGGPVVSMTSHGTRVNLCYIALESIARGSLKPGRVVLWLDDEGAFLKLPSSLRRLQKRGLELRVTRNYGPHTKYFPAILDGVWETGDLVTADDDVLYPRRWLRALVRVRQFDARSIIAYRARRVRIQSESFLQPYDRWPLSTRAEPSFRNFATGHSGVMYPPTMVNELRSRGDAFLSCCPKNDDVWLNHVAVSSGHKVRLVDTEAVQFDTVTASQKVALKHSNVTRGANDSQISATYCKSDMDKLRQACEQDGVVY